MKNNISQSEEFLKESNHHHELTENHIVVNLGSGDFVANKEALPLLAALAAVGLKTRTHHYQGGKHGFFSIIIDDSVECEIREVSERNSSRDEYEGKSEVIINW